MNLIFYQTQGPNRKRKESLNIVNDGLYRIQYESKEELLHCCYYAKDREVESRYARNLDLKSRYSLKPTATNTIEENGAESNTKVAVERELELQDVQANKRMKLE